MIFVAICIQPAFAQTDQTETTEMPIVEKISSDGSVKVRIDANLPKADSPLIINLRFIDANTNHDIPNVNYDIVALQNGEPVLSQVGMYTQSGIAQHITGALSTDSHVDVMVILHGIGESSPYSGPRGEMFEARIVPEFGTVAIIMLVITISMAVVLHKSKLG